MIELSVKHIPWPFPKSVHAVTLWPFIIYEKQVRNHPAVQAHERYHWKDQMRWLVIPWFIIYVALLPFYGGFRKHPFDRPAYEIEDAEKDKIRRRGKEKK